MRLGLALALLAGLAAPALATDYFVRTDGSDTNTGTANTASGAWRTVKKCVQTATAGDRCLIQPGTYQEKQISQVNAGQLLRNNADFNSDGTADRCSCTKGSTSITCDRTVTGIAAGNFVQCDTGFGFSWSRVASVSGTTITLSEPYRGATGASDTLDTAKFVEILGQGATREEVTISSFYNKPGAVTWTKESGYSCVYSYTKSVTTDPAWSSPQGFRENVSDAEWDIYGKNTNGRDTFIKTASGRCPCARSGVQSQVDSMFGSWADDGTKVYLQTRNCQDPNTRPIQASNAAEYQSVLDSQKAYTIVDNLTVEGAGPDDGYTNVSFLYVVNLGASNARYSRMRVQNGRARMVLSDGLTDTRFEDFRSLTGSLWGNGMNMSGVHFYNTEWRGGYTNLISIDQISGVSTADRVVFDRFFVHRAFSQYRAAECAAGGDYFNCSTKGWKNEFYGVHGYFLGNETVARAIDHLLFQNCIVELTADGLAVFHGAGASDVVVRNCTFGYSGSAGGNFHQEMIQFGNSADANYAAKVYNTVFYCDNSMKDCDQRIQMRGGSYNRLTSDYNLYLLPYNTVNNSSYPIWGGGSSQKTLAQAINEYGQESHSLMVCNSSCSGATGRYYNDGANSRTYFVDADPLDGDGTDYTPNSHSRAINAGLNAECPAEDFYGNPRNDGTCDIGAVEYQNNPPDTTPPAAVTNFAAAPGNTQVTLSWNHSASSDSKGTMVRFKTTGYPTSRTDGTLVCDKLAAPGTADSCLHTGLTNGTAYYYAAFSYDQAGNYGTGAQATATPSAPVNTNPADVQNFHRTDTK